MRRLFEGGAYMIYGISLGAFKVPYTFRSEKISENSFLFAILIVKDKVWGKMNFFQNVGPWFTTVPGFLAKKKG